MQPLYPRLRASKSVPREQVRADQARRLRGAMVEAVWRHGYEQTTVDRLVALAGVSTRALYDVFGSKLGCFEATCAQILEHQARAIAGACTTDNGPLGWEQRMQFALDAFVSEIVDRPRTARLALAESVAVGDPIRATLDRAEAVFEALLLDALRRADSEGGGALPPSLARAILHGLWSLARRSLLEGREQELRSAGPHLLGWLLTLLPPASEQQRLLELTSLPRGRLPVASHADRVSREHPRDSTAAPHEYRQRNGRVRRRDLPAAVEMESARALARALRNASGAADWAQAVCLGLDSLYCDAARDPAFARLCFVEVLAPGAALAARRGALLRRFADLLAARTPGPHAPDPLTAELIAGAVWGIAHREVLPGNARALPSLTAVAAYVTLAPILGAGQALDAIAAWTADWART